MHEISTSAALAAELTANADELTALTGRVAGEADSQPRIDSSGWSGPASWACQLSLTLLARQMDQAVELLRCAADLTAAAAWEARAGA
jgi:PPE-repeat protein